MNNHSPNVSHHRPAEAGTMNGFVGLLIKSGLFDDWWSFSGTLFVFILVCAVYPIIGFICGAKVLALINPISMLVFVGVWGFWMCRRIERNFPVGVMDKIVFRWRDALINHNANLYNRKTKQKNREASNVSICSSVPIVNSNQKSAQYD